MVRHYIIETNNGNWSESNMKMAMKLWKEKSVQKAASSFSVPKDMLHRRLKRVLKIYMNERKNKMY